MDTYRELLRYNTILERLSINLVFICLLIPATYQYTSNASNEARATTSLGPGVIQRVEFGVIRDFSVIFYALVKELEEEIFDGWVSLGNVFGVNPSCLRSVVCGLTILAMDSDCRPYNINNYTN